VWQKIEDASLIVLVKNNQMFCAGKGIDDGKDVETQLNTAGVSYTLLPWLPLLHCSVKNKQEGNIEHQQTKELSNKHKICCSNEVVLGCFGCITVMYRQHIAVKIW
jgi:hypothetical protein